MFKVIAHRAKINGHLENSLSAIAACVERKVTGIEIDIRHTTDGFPVIFHDSDIKRLTINHFKENDRVPLVRELQKNQFLTDYKLVNRESVPELVDAFSLLNKTNIMLVLELKDKPTELTLQLIKTYLSAEPDKLRIISFDHEILKALKSHDDFFKTVKMMALFEVPRTGWINKRVPEIEGVNTNLIHPLQALWFKSQNIEVGLWWLPDKIPPTLVKSLFSSIDFLTTDHYDLYDERAGGLPKNKK